MPKLNPEQNRAVNTIDSPLLVLAGAGSGKTRVITEKIAYLVKQGLPARHIAALTFTNKAAREMKERVGKLLDDKQLRGLRVSTFHSLGLDILRKEHKTLQYKAGISLFDEQDKITLLKNLIMHSHANYDIDNVESYSGKIGQWKNAFITPEQAKSHASAEDNDAAHLYADYTRSLKAYNAVDFDDLILLPVLLFQNHTDILEKWQNKIRYLLVDEYQDTNITQYQLVKLLVGKLGKFTVVGDDDQSIYAWRGAQPENLAQLQKDYARLTVIKLEQNYRSYGRILKVANQLIANNPHAFEKKLWSDMSFGEPLRVLTHKNDNEEAKQVVSEIVHHKFKTGADYGDYAILYRGNHQSRLFERSLREHDVPYFITGSTSFFAYAEIKDILSYLKLFVNPDNDAAFLRIVNTPRREIGPTTLEKLGAYANERHISLFSACSEMGVREKLPQAALARLQKFCEWTHRTASSMQMGDTFAEMNAFIEQINYHQWLQENSNTQQAAERKIKNVTELVEWLQRIAKSEDDNEQEKTLDEIVSKIQLMDILDRNQDEQAENQVSLMTLHAAKGLEFPHVFLIGIEENILPHQNSIETDNIEEERRLAYVGITRAQHTCTFSYCTHRKRYGDISESEPSRFLAELPEEDLEWASKKPADEAEQKVRGKANLAHLKSMLS
ncbi:ATP-dependent DNA helicase Rep [Bathymodiolus platifrons methanotrophic gill symbiont]|uniref:DNA helicase Rep n=1 Tax=Bathymodiolus platifrons methanotrophic gill symbiont TaxID=113268 RepID=UPI000B4159C7|nr:DNA helicase Rep [Bathymodiolus platifrons methanotrophic gill symbiont]MCK5869670.1 DNA helicase Rep [Methyloprofundus sp.]TXK95180.1 DNA helicase Rep [Methylococcaceae bacterium CS4]TXK96256.1 DNA helicase Rep [Methylococcaceae bacterium CS5]TXL06157.1 DNA helicase Rep [Methylococcaceae bacterium CS1]TXL06547.1 DNA helicase Rep [Methylococcaceae bacterium CS3]TXL09744.1 DNA helicase Rep [Methylococcaceae bacterium CS2]TXL14770.1 DNA helicase Rep [Methylococcaceae bacterium HT4]TXL19068